jgi:hypothetical protein
MTTPIFPMLTVIHPVYKIISTLTRPALELELFTREYLRVLKEAA